MRASLSLPPASLPIPLFAAALILASPAQAQLPFDPGRDTVAPLPAPSGPAPVGTTVAYLVDSARRDSLLPAGRPIALQVWYPARAGGGATAPYLLEAGLGEMLLRKGYYQIDSASLRRWTTLATHARLDAEPATGRHPLLTFSVGLGLLRANYTALAEELASRGWVVALVESPFLGRMLWPDGREIADTLGLFEEPAAHRAAVDVWACDVRWMLDRLQAGGNSGGLPPPAARVAGTIDFARVAAAGHSSGGLVAVTSAEADRRVRAAVDLDGGMAAPTGEPIASFVSTGTTKPVLLLRSRPLYQAADFARRGITREKWEQDGAAGRLALDSVAARARGPWRVAALSGTGHLSFSDAPFVMPYTIRRFGGRIIDGRLGERITAEAILAFLAEALDGRQGALAAVAARHPELVLTR